MSAERDFRVNRVLSARLTTVLLKYPITPNHVTLMSLASGVAAGLLLANGGYFTALLGAVFYQLACVLDNCDGEIARAKKLKSKMGEWYDIAADFGVDMALFSGLAMHVRVTGTGPAGLLLGAAVFGGVLHLFMVVAEKLKGFGPAVYETPNARKAGSDNVLLRIFDSVREGDASLIVVLFALVGQIPALLWIVAVYMQVLWISAVIVNRRHFGF